MIDATGRHTGGPRRRIRLPRPAALYEALVEEMPDELVRCRALGGLYVCGALLALLACTMPPPAGVSRAAILALAVTAGAIGLLILCFPRLLRRTSLAPVVGLGTVLISVGVYCSRATDSVVALLYVWSAFEAAYFLTRRQAIGQLGLIGASYAVALAVAPGGGRAVHWLLLMGTVLAAAGLVGLMRVRMNRVVERLSDASRTDPLTGLLNRRGFAELVDVELGRARRSGRPLSLLVADLDHFKRLNDHVGHAAGDAALARFAAVARSCCRRHDVVGRLGGEEFALLLPDADAERGFLVAERLRAGFAEATAAGTRCTVSVGIASTATARPDREGMTEAADQALYAAKALGRDRCVIYSREVIDGVLGTPSASGHEQLSAMLLLAETLDVRLHGGTEHSRTVGRLAAIIASHLGFESDHVERVRLAGILHDIGKVALPGAILEKDGPLTADEWAQVRSHPEIGAHVVAAARLDDVSAWVRAHHERPDGDGYPGRLSGGRIPLEARILAVADAYEAMVNGRAHRDALRPEDALRELHRHAGAQFDGRVVDALAAALAQCELAGRGAEPGVRGQG
jgi:diguanylate cyclase (GGDEF)-like protein/putative nucleotidyltransferase with HDIG domain